MYPALPGDGGPSSGYGAFGNSHAASTSYGAQQPPRHPGQPQLQRQGSVETAQPWGADTTSTLRVKIADDYRLDPPVQMPPALAASGSRRGAEFDFDFERQVMAGDASTSIDAFLAKPEESYYEHTKAGRFVRAGFSAATVNLALAYHAAHRGDESQITAFCEHFKTLTQDMSFNTRLAAGALVVSKNDLAAAANHITELS